MKAGRDLLFEGGVGQHVPCDLLDSKFLERHILIERLDYPVTKFPGRAPVVFFVAVGIGITRQVQPRTRPALTVIGGSQQPVHQLLISVWIRIRQKEVHLLNRWRQPSQV